MRIEYILLLCIPATFFAQELEKKDSLLIWDGDCGSKIYYSLKEAAEANPDSVICLHLGNNGIKKFPMEVLKYKNLRRLTFNNLDLLTQSKITPWLLNSEDKAKVTEILQKHPNAGDKGIYLYFPTRNKTRVKRIPKEIKQLTKLTQFSFNGGVIFYQRKLKRVEKLIPYCEVDIE